MFWKLNIQNNIDMNFEEYRKNREMRNDKRNFIGLLIIALLFIILFGVIIWFHIVPFLIENLHF